MTLWLLLFVLSGTPKLGPIITVRQQDGSWKCSSTCQTAGNADGGVCRAFVPGRGATEDACKTDLATRCAKMKPLPGGCRWGSNPPAASK